ncbi:DUF2244 domain-containing protein [Methyloraptor flagellatus]|jgi:uncharacterized membrane protein|uniref:DUF2244 domain-containing protein n=1 Tax=Methyloraptor flagellatus TaxID=3162530 RepID=A0AAU7X6H9_9HYPH
MTTGNAEPADPPFFSAVLTPHRSLGPRGLALLLGGVGVVSGVTALAFSLLGAWPVVGFAGADVALIALAFAANYRSARAREEIAVGPLEILFTKVGPRGDRIDYRFNPVWVRLEIERVPDEGVTHIYLYSRGRGVEIGAFLNPDDRTSFADALGAALRAARAGTVRSGMAFAAQ